MTKLTLSATSKKGRLLPDVTNAAAAVKGMRLAERRPNGEIHGYVRVFGRV